MAGRPRIAAQMEVLQISEICPPANVVLAQDSRPVVDELELLFAFAQGTSAGVCSRRITEPHKIDVPGNRQTGKVRIIQLDIWHARSIRIEVQAHDACIRRRRGAAVQGVQSKVVTEKTKSKIRQQVGSQVP